ncbi:radical SAM protein [Anaeroselena agilis]|uniref:Radical SAM protein n=1 Tax=Anaeroselena agilis TaxID=3063788 RepID=A0ABU3NVU4_9FIRM|nr:radical SAM protein [Selenomonadales bacterium 4137-cl]
MLTESCPSRCTYCYIKDRDGNSEMTMDTVDRIIAEHNPYRVIFFGGEPMLKPRLMEEILQKYHGSRKFQIVTSGLVNMDYLKYFQRRYPLDEIQVSWDGDGVHSRPLGDLALRNILDLSRTSSLDIKCVLNDANIKDMAVIHRRFTDLQKEGINGEFVIAHRPDTSEDFVREFRRQLPNCLEVEGKTYQEFLTKIQAVINRDEGFCSCDAGQYLVFRPNGEKHHCTILSQHKYFSVEELTQPCTHPDCRQCDIRFLCDGGCRYERYAVFGDDWQGMYLPQTCSLNRAYHEVITEWLHNLSPAYRHKLNGTLLRYRHFKNQYMGVN